MLRFAVFLTLFVPCAMAFRLGSADEAIHMPRDPHLSPDGQRLAFAWDGDIWTSSSTGGVARQLTTSAARESRPKFSPDGQQVAFLSDREGRDQVFVMPARGGQPVQMTFHSEGCSLEEWSPDGTQWLVQATRDHFWRHAERFFLVEAEPRALEHLLLDDYGDHGRLSPDGRKLLFSREGVAWWRKGYHGSQASQVWLYDREDQTFDQLVDSQHGARYPLWHPDGERFYYVGAREGAFNLYERRLEDGEERKLTDYDDDGVVMPCIARDGSAIVYRHLFDFYRLTLEGDAEPTRIRLRHRGDQRHEAITRDTISSAADVAFSNDGLEIAFVAGGDVWVMDTVLREPKQITNTPEEERDPAFAPDGSSIVFVSDAEGRSDIWKAERADTELYWWQNTTFSLKRLTEDADVEQSVRWSPDGEKLSFVRGLGDLWLMSPDGKEPRRLLESWNVPDYDWSPDGKWIAYSLSDNEFNQDVFILPIDGSREPYNLSRHPDNDGEPIWSPDGKMIAFTGRRLGTETDIYYVLLRKEDEETTSRDRKLKEAIEKLQKARKEKPQSDKGDDAAERKEEESTSDKEQATPDKLPEVKIDFDGLPERLRRVSIADTSEADLFWSHDSEKLAFVATIDGKRGTYTISPPSDLSPKLLTTETGSRARWLSKGNQIVWLSSGKPASVDAAGKVTSYSFSARQTVDHAKRRETIFDLCWRAMRDHYYDERLNNRNWDAVRRKYIEAAREAIDDQTLEDVIEMMLGELNGSHLGFTRTSEGPDVSSTWRETTAHLGVRFERDYPGPGWKVRDVLLNGPADAERSRLFAGDVILSIDQVEVDPAMEPTALLNGSLERDILLRVRAPSGEERQVVLRPISYGVARLLLYEQWIKHNQSRVDELSRGRLGYLHIRGMNMTSFYRFEQELFAVAAGKDGLVIDVRENGGGSTTDHLLTVLTQPMHAITVPRGGGPGYPHDRKIYATWNKPIVVLCNQNSFSNAEIFSHAIKTLQRGQLVGVPTAGGVISTGSRRILDAGLLRMPFRGWFVLGSGQDMELNGARPDHILWPSPGDMAAGKDGQLDKAIEVLLADVAAWQARPQLQRIKASERDGVDP